MEQRSTAVDSAATGPSPPYLRRVLPQGPGSTPSGQLPGLQELLGLQNVRSSLPRMQSSRHAPARRYLRALACLSLSGRTMPGKDPYAPYHDQLRVNGSHCNKHVVTHDKPDKNQLGNVRTRLAEKFCCTQPDRSYHAITVSIPGR